MAANTIISSVVTAGSNNHTTIAEEINAYATDFVTQGVVGAITLNAGSGGTGSFCVNADASPDMGVTVKSGQAYITATPSSQDSQVLRARTTTDYTAYTINANASGSTKYDWIYLSVSAANANVPSATADNVTSIFTSRSSSNSTDNGTPPTYGLLLAIVTVANGASSITNANITDKRFNTSIGAQNGSLIVTQSGTGVDAKIQTAGVDANIALDINSKGTGAIKFTAGSGGITGVIESVKNPYKFCVYLAGSQNSNGGGVCTVLFDAKTFDTGNNVSGATFTAPIAGFYHFGWTVTSPGGTELGIWHADLAKNSSLVVNGSNSGYLGASEAEYATSAGSGIIQMAANDTATILLTATSTAVITAGLATQFNGFLVSAT